MLSDRECVNAILPLPFNDDLSAAVLPKTSDIRDITSYVQNL